MNIQPIMVKKTNIFYNKNKGRLLMILKMVTHTNDNE